MNINLRALGGRRFLMAMGAGAMTTALQWFGKLDPAGTTYAIVIGSTVAAYIAGNVAESNKAPQSGDKE